jgi:hypothetical protein
MWWLWWHQRNKAREGEIPDSAINVGHKEICSAAEFLECFKKEKMTTFRKKIMCGRHHLLRFNFDGAFTHNKNFRGWAVISVIQRVR